MVAPSSCASGRLDDGGLGPTPEILSGRALMAADRVELPFSFDPAPLSRRTNPRNDLGTNHL